MKFQVEILDSRCTFMLDDGTTEVVKVVIWHDQMHILPTDFQDGFDITLLDVKVKNSDSSKRWQGKAVATVHSCSSTSLKVILVE